MMHDISIKQIDEITRFWVFYVKEDGEPGNIQLSACANNFAIHRGGGSSMRTLKAGSTHSAGKPSKNPIEVNPND